VVPLDRAAIDPRFRIDTRVAGGSGSDVFKGLDTLTGEVVAIKRLHEFLCEPGTRARFEREARILAALRDPHVVRYIAHGLDAGGCPFLVLEWLDGEDLRAWRRGAGHRARHAVELVRQGALGLAALHEAGIVHRDVKPSNFFLAGTIDAPRVVLIDLGIACAMSDVEPDMEGRIIGTPLYMSPEQLLGQQPLGPRSDLFSLGVVLFELCAGKNPFDGGGISARVAELRHEHPPRLRDWVPSLDPELDALVAKVMARRPEERFSSARELALALASLPPSDELLPGLPHDPETDTLPSSAADEQR
jgi:serine/threonine protein kinase